MPIQIDSTDAGRQIKTNFFIEVQQAQQQYILEDNVRNESIISTEVNGVQCGNRNTYVLTNGGEVYASGNNSYG